MTCSKYNTCNTAIPCNSICHSPALAPAHHRRCCRALGHCRHTLIMSVPPLSSSLAAPVLVAGCPRPHRHCTLIPPSSPSLATATDRRPTAAGRRCRPAIAGRCRRPAVAGHCRCPILVLIVSCPRCHRGTTSLSLSVHPAIIIVLILALSLPSSLALVLVAGRPCRLPIVLVVGCEESTKK